MNHRPRLLLLSGTSLVGRNVLECLAGRRASIEVAATTSAPEEPAAFDFDAAYLTPEIRREPDAFAARLRDVMADFEPDLVIPCRDDDVTYLARERTRGPAMAHRLLCGDAAVAEAMLDKNESARFSKLNGLPFVPTLSSDGDFDSARRFAAEHGFPLIGKPRHGYASRGVRIILDERQLEHASRQPDYVIQEYLGRAEPIHQRVVDWANGGIPLFHSLEQRKLSIQALIGPDGAVHGVFCSENSMRFGRSEAVRLIDEPAMKAAAEQWAATVSKAGWRGPLNMQCHRNGRGELTIFEYNGRFTGATAARRLLGFDEVGRALRVWLGLELPQDALPPAPEVVRHSVSRAVERAQSERLRREGYWAANEARPRS